MINSSTEAYNFIPKDPAAHLISQDICLYITKTGVKVFKHRVRWLHY